MRRYRNLFIALAAIASIFLVKWTGIDGGLIDNALRAGVDAVTAEDTPEPVELPAETTPYEHSATPYDSSLKPSEEHR